MAVPLYIVSIVVLVLLSAFFSATETAFSSISKIRLRSLSSSTSSRSRIVVKLCNDYDTLISTVLIGNNIVNIGATTLSTLLFAILIVSPTLAPTVSTIVMTLVVLIFGEITPKTVAKKSPEFFAHLFAPMILVVYFLLYPLTWVFSLWQKFIGKIFKKRDKDNITDEQLITMVDEAKIEGGLDEYESKLIRSAIKFDDLTLMDIITPRVDVIAVDIKTSPQDVLRTFVESGYTRIPVFKGNIDNIIGVLNEKDFGREYIRCMNSDGVDDVNIAEVIDEGVIFATSGMKISTLLRKLQKEQTHLAVVVDEFGGTLGIATLEDILEELVGEIWDEHDEVEEDFVSIDSNRCEVRGDVSLEDFFEYFGIDQDSKEYDPVTVSGLVVTILDRVARVGDIVEFENLTLQVKSLDHHKVDIVEVTYGDNSGEN